MCGIYMGCSDVSEFEHIYGQISTTPSCVYGRLFTWTRMVVVNALIVWKKVDRHLLFHKVKSFDIDSCLYEIPKNAWVDDTKLCHRSLSRDVLLPHRRAGRLHCEKAEYIQLCDFADGSSHYRCWSAVLLIIPAMCSPSSGPDHGPRGPLGLEATAGFS